MKNRFFDVAPEERLLAFSKSESRHPVEFSTSSVRSSGPKPDLDIKLAADVKSGIIKLGTGSAARIEVKLRDKTKIKGYVQEIAEDHFVVVEDRTGVTSTIAYTQVKQVKGNNLATGAKFAIFVLIMSVIFAIANSGGAP